MRELKKVRNHLLGIDGKQISLTDPDARSMNSAGKGTGTVGYNVQTVVDVENHMIVAHEVTNVGRDRSQLTPMSKRAQDALGTKGLTVLADRGYFNGEEILRCQSEGCTPLVPKPLTSGSKPDGALTNAILFTTPNGTNTDARPASARFGDSQQSKMARQ
jgi:hypothetical protein